MNRRWRYGVGLAGVAVLASLAVAEEPAPSLVRSAAPDWPQWRGPRRDGISEEKGLLQSWPEGGPKLLWKVTGIGRGYSSPVVAADGVYVTGDQDKELIISAFTLDGQPRWKTPNGERLMFCYSCWVC